MKRIKGLYIGLFLFAVTLVTVPAHAAVDLTDFTIDMASVEALAAIVLAALAVVFGIRKLIKLANRS